MLKSLPERSDAASSHAGFIQSDQRTLLQEITMPPVEVALPPSSGIEVAGACFHDCFEASIDLRGCSALGISLATFVRVPRWVQGLMTLRNRVVQVVGLKDLGAMGDIDPNRAESSYRVGDRVGIFTLRSISRHAVVLGDSDQHLDVDVHVQLPEDRPGIVRVTTVVRVHNRLGRLYMAFIVPVHKRIVRALLAGVDRAVRSGAD